MRRSAGLEKWWIAGALAVLLAAGSAQAQDPVKGGSLVVARVADIFTFDPYNTQDDRSIFTELTLYDRLVKLSPDGKNRRCVSACCSFAFCNGCERTRRAYCLEQSQAWRLRPRT